MRYVQFSRSRDVTCFSDKQLDQLAILLPELEYLKATAKNGFPSEICFIENTDEATPESKVVFKFVSIGTDLESGSTYFQYKESNLAGERLASYLESISDEYMKFAIKTEIEGRKADLFINRLDDTEPRAGSWVDSEIARIRARRADSIAAAAHCDLPS